MRNFSTLSVYNAPGIESGEYIEWKLKTNSSGNLFIYTNGKGFDGNTTNYKWLIYINGEYQGYFQGKGNDIQLSGLNANTLYNIKIVPNKVEYGRARALGSPLSQLYSVIHDDTYIGFGLTAESTGAYFRASQYKDCNNLTSIPAETMPNTVTAIGQRFREGQYEGCTSITHNTEEVLSTNTNTISTYFRQLQYSGCSNLVSVYDEYIPNSVTFISQYFRSLQFNNCTSLTTPAVESIPQDANVAGGWFRIQQYKGCTSLISTAVEVLPNLSNPVTYRYSQYYGCTSLKYVYMYSYPDRDCREDQFTGAGNSNDPMLVKITGPGIDKGVNAAGLDNNNVQRVVVPSNLIDSYKSATNWDSIDNWKFGPEGDNTFNIVTEDGSTIITETQYYGIITEFSETEIEQPGIGIYYNEGLGLISLSSDGENRMTISDKNLGAIMAWEEYYILDEDNIGKTFQWGNNNQFPSTIDTTSIIDTSNTQVDATGYGPNNYYSSSTYIVGNFNWSSVRNNNLWGGATGTNDAMQGPCPEGFHIPSETEFQNLITLMTSIGISYTQSNLYSMYLKMPLTGIRNYLNGIGGVGSYTCLWSSSPDSLSPFVKYLDLGNAGVEICSTKHLASARYIRPFKNIPVVPDILWEVIYTPS